MSSEALKAFSAIRIGKWKKAQLTLRGLPVAWRVAYQRALVAEGHYLHGKIVEGIKLQAPGGKPFKPPAKSTLAVRRMKGRTGTKALIDRGELIKAFEVVFRRDMVFVGVLEGRRDSEGVSFTSILETHENGRVIVMSFTAAQARFLAAVRAEAGGAGNSSAGPGTGTVVIRIPPRPILQPVRDKYATGILFRERMKFRIGQAMGGQLGTVVVGGFSTSGTR